MEIKIDDLQGSDVLLLLKQHLQDMYATSPTESIHALDIEALKHPFITFWRAEIEGVIQGCIALKELDSKHAEIKSMRTATHARNQGIASQLLSHVLNVAKIRSYETVSLETGTMDYFLPARKLYEKHGFVYCDPFGEYQFDPHSCFMTRKV
ncbi:GNAT family N-acetyltransferase [Pseudoalteromonas fenneropenaei]|uniref:GNAT family N-acetyltransferase n=1 Tax=Pseudoalteromonas fenneropenaei TaxID=1737459 RepID=A0ABV7CHX1_9GAMM